MLIVKAIVTTVPVDKLSSAEGLPEILAGITPYAERHFERLDLLRRSLHESQTIYEQLSIIIDRR